ncbi:Secondary metabolism regulator LAE1 [Colletotrichum spinosum]|uniref:Secondary metabolism regulator LAE1 n=1 Tax=Colletotrichum spinosum TaxID=1347390 RepID=A0A4R8QBG7_9PEZI|nr:Secondary metabolism regulator LAE1 [Colletotrichum spinosum]
MAESTQQPALQAEDTDDASSIGGETLDYSTASLRSSIIDYRRENGRTYHRVSDGKYYGPNDEEEQDRLDFSHHLWLLTWDKELCNCPKKNGASRVLDVGTGTGIWALDYAEAHPEADVTGVDLSPIQPNYVVPNCRFEVDDVDKEWTWSEPFDFIFIRSMIGSFKDWQSIVAKAYDNLEPGGYLELHDNGFPLECDDNTLPEDSKVLKWTQLLIQATDIIGQPGTVAPLFKKLLEEAGFEAVEERRERWPLNPWPKDPKAKELGLWCHSAIVKGVDSISLALFTRILGWSKEETIVFNAEVRNETKKSSIHGYFPVYAAWGRKPLKEASEAPQQ